MTFPNDSRSPMDPIDPRTTSRDTRVQNDTIREGGRSNGSKMALMAFGVLAILGVVMYGMNSATDTNTARTTSPTTTSSTQSTAPTASTPTTGTPAGENTGAAPPVTTR